MFVLPSTALAGLLSVATIYAVSSRVVPSESGRHGGDASLPEFLREPSSSEKAPSSATPPAPPDVSSRELASVLAEGTSESAEGARHPDAGAALAAPAPSIQMAPAAPPVAAAPALAQAPRAVTTRQPETVTPRASSPKASAPPTAPRQAQGKPATTAPPKAVSVAELKEGVERRRVGRALCPKASQTRAAPSTCHDGEPGRLLGVAAVQEPALPEVLVSVAPPRALLPLAPDAARAALGYLHANCAHCRNPRGSARPDTDLDLRLSVSDRDANATAASRTAVGQPLRRPASALERLRVSPGVPEQSGLWQRMRQRGNAFQMPPLATERAESDGLARVPAWIESLPAAQGTD